MYISGASENTRYLILEHSSTPVLPICSLFIYVSLTDIRKNQVHEYWLQLTISSHSFCLSGSRRFFKPSTSLRSEPMYAFFCDNTTLSSSRHGVNCSTSSLVSYNKMTLHVMYCIQCRLNYITCVYVSSTMLSVVSNGRMMCIMMWKGCRTKQLWSNFRYYPSICMESCPWIWLIKQHSTKAYGTSRSIAPSLLTSAPDTHKYRVRQASFLFSYCTKKTVVKISSIFFITKGTHLKLWFTSF
jgi:hypothetical protein